MSEIVCVSVCVCVCVCVCCVFSTLSQLGVVTELLFYREEAIATEEANEQIWSLSLIKKICSNSLARSEDGDLVKKEEGKTKKHLSDAKKTV
jgi:hypothetical protein